MARKTNDVILRTVKSERELLNIMNRRKTSRPRNTDWKKMSWLQNLRQWTGLRRVGDPFSTIRNMEEGAHVIAHIHVPISSNRRGRMRILGLNVTYQFPQYTICVCLSSKVVLVFSCLFHALPELLPSQLRTSFHSNC